MPGRRAEVGREEEAFENHEDRVKDRVNRAIFLRFRLGAWLDLEPASASPGATVWAAAFFDRAQGGREQFAELVDQFGRGAAVVGVLGSIRMINRLMDSGRPG